MEGWLCPELFKDFNKTPKELYGRAEAKTERKMGRAISFL